MNRKIVILFLLIILNTYGNNEYISKEVKSCNEGSGMACFFVGASYLEGKGVDKDILKGVEYLEKACESGASVACYNLGNMYARGNSSIVKTIPKAKELYKKACDKGITNACYNLNILNSKEIKAPVSE